MVESDHRGWKQIEMESGAIKIGAHAAACNLLAKAFQEGSVPRTPNTNVSGPPFSNSGSCLLLGDSVASIRCLDNFGNLVCTCFCCTSLLRFEALRACSFFSVWLLDCELNCCYMLHCIFHRPLRFAVAQLFCIVPFLADVILGSRWYYGFCWCLTKSW